MSTRFPAPFLLVALLAAPLAAQDHQHQPGMVHPGTAEVGPPTQPGQAAFGAISEIVARLDADPNTDWSKVDIEALRQHLIDMDNVTLRSRITTEPVAGGFRATVTGDGAVVASIRRMTSAHARTMVAEGAFDAEVTEVPGGVRMTVTSKTPDDARSVARLRGLGVIGVLTLGSHHQAHHEMMAKGVTH